MTVPIYAPSVVGTLSWWRGLATHMCGWGSGDPPGVRSLTGTRGALWRWTHPSLAARGNKMKKTKTQNPKQNVLKNETKKQKNEGNKNEERSRSRSPVTTRDRKSEGCGGSGKSKKGGVRVRECDEQEYKKGKDYGKEYFAKLVEKDSGKEASKSKGKRTAQELDNTEEWEVVLSKNKGRKEKEKKRKKEKEDEGNEHEDGVDDERRSMSVDKRISSSEQGKRGAIRVPVCRALQTRKGRM
ncbi:hypothetical protein QAD02_010504 [Eretmocerus hayati]|uniref:Uncharacterized protein n=1 Tax=Eretmocerus hayati TaxID=131215 RepID=A0ACC2NV18_9HYME|nr:hypothetical protein QAD02_010504 [Eretmocerus hayati]